jgi:DNA polymerase III sliding clamp (beta) subunit (PCNA family)
VSLLKALGLVSVILSPWRWNTIYLEFSLGKLNLLTSDDNGCEADADSAETEILCDYSGEEIEIALNIAHFTEIIKHIDTERVNIRFDTNNTTVAVLPEPLQDYYFFVSQRKRGK